MTSFLSLLLTLLTFTTTIRISASSHLIYAGLNNHNWWSKDSSKLNQEKQTKPVQVSPSTRSNLNRESTAKRKQERRRKIRTKMLNKANVRRQGPGRRSSGQRNKESPKSPMPKSTRQSNSRVPEYVVILHGPLSTSINPWGPEKPTGHVMRYLILYGNSHQALLEIRPNNHETKDYIRDHESKFFVLPESNFFVLHKHPVFIVDGQLVGIATKSGAGMQLKASDKKEANTWARAFALFDENTRFLDESKVKSTLPPNPNPNGYLPPLPPLPDDDTNLLSGYFYSTKPTSTKYVEKIWGLAMFTLHKTSLKYQDEYEIVVIPLRMMMRIESVNDEEQRDMGLGFEPSFEPSAGILRFIYWYWETGKRNLISTNHIDVKFNDPVAIKRIMDQAMQAVVEPPSELFNRILPIWKRNEEEDKKKRGMVRVTVESESNHEEEEDKKKRDMVRVTVESESNHEEEEDKKKRDMVTKQIPRVNPGTGIRVRGKKIANVLETIVEGENESESDHEEEMNDKDCRVM